MDAEPTNSSETNPGHSQRPSVLRISWTELLLLSWHFEPAVLRPWIPTDLDLDLFNGRAWVTVAASGMAQIRPCWMPALPWISKGLSLGVRTYVRRGSERGLFLFSLDTNSTLTAACGRSLFHLPCFRAKTRLNEGENAVSFSSVRCHQGASPAHFECTWRLSAPSGKPPEVAFPHFLSGRHQVFADHRGKLLSCRLQQPPFLLRQVTVESLHSSMLESAGIPRPEAEPFAHRADSRVVEIWPMRPVSADDDAASMLEPALAPPTG